ncbi:methyltransferase [Urbifossiella limnaea]|uniref:Methyltransferase domain protein n=1 Tax=Urbifossiella limnaea TaxID=2528023 RepID=A0A517XSF4_9BACT|nr:methyltransferase [Urbifossiella limnaea]QDU20440.1 Methyltransferase domain protein [Urbifossiella limnaea]
MSDPRSIVTAAVLGPGFRRGTFAGVARGENPAGWVRVVVRPVELRGGRQLQFAYYDARQCRTHNVSRGESEARLDQLMSVGFSAVHLDTDAGGTDIRLSKKGKVLVGRTAPASAASTAHNREKDLPLPEGRADHLLEAIGVMTPDGRVRPTMRAKFTQVNEFLKHLDHKLDDAGLRGLGRPVEILDCGSGSGHLTLAAHHYLNDVLGIPARVTGVDANPHVVQKSAAAADRIAADGAGFACARIGTFGGPADVVLALHACDTATDDALAQAVRSEARLVLSVPCCHQALNPVVKSNGPATVLRPVLRHGILQQRTADILTDALRALALRIMGYRTDVVEFVSPEHTARNLMIRATSGLPVGDPTFVAEYRELCRFWGVTPYLETALGDPFRRLVREEPT